MAPREGACVRNIKLHGTIIKNLLLQNHLAQKLEIRFTINKDCSNEGLRGLLGMNHRIT